MEAAIKSKSVTETVLSQIEGSDGIELEEHDSNHERWLVSYADLMTLLFGFFVMMYSQSGSFENMRNSIAEKFLGQKPAATAQTESVEKMQILQDELTRTKEALAKAQAPLDISAFQPQVHAAAAASNSTQAPEAQLAAAQKIISQQKKELRLASIEPCRLCVTWTMMDDPEITTGLGSPGAKGLIITEVKTGGPADRAGLLVGDIVVKVDQKSVDSFAETEKTFQGMAVNARVPLGIIRSGQPITLYPTLDYLSQEELRAFEIEENIAAPKDVFPGLSAQELSTASRLRNYIPSNVKGVLVTRVQKGSLADRSAIQVGSVIQYIDGQKIETVNGASQLLRTNRASHVLLVSHRNSKHFIVLK